MTEEHETDSVINMEEALQCTSGDREMLLTMAELFLEEGPRQWQAVRSRIEAGDVDGIRETAHTLKGSVVIFGARPAAEAAVAVEDAAGGDDSTQLEAAWERLNQEMERLLRAVAQLGDS